MPDYTVRDPHSGRTVTLRGDSAPSEAELEQVFASLSPSTTSRPVTPDVDPAVLAGANVGRAAAARVGEELATSPKVGKTIGILSKPLGQAALRVAGVSTGGLPGYLAGEALAHPAVGGAIESGVRATGAGVARAASSGLARALTGVPMTALALPGMPLNATPVGETRAEAQRAIQDSMYAHRRQDEINRATGKMSIKGDTTRELLDSIKDFESRTHTQDPAKYYGGPR